MQKKFTLVKKIRHLKEEGADVDLNNNNHI